MKRWKLMEIFEHIASISTQKGKIAFDDYKNIAFKKIHALKSGGLIEEDFRYNISLTEKGKILWNVWNNIKIES